MLMTPGRSTEAGSTGIMPLIAATCCPSLRRARHLLCRLGFASHRISSCGLSVFLLLLKLPSALQVAATAALLEAVRGEEGSGRVDNDLLAATVSALVCSKLAAADAISYFITTFLPHADVRCVHCAAMSLCQLRGNAHSLACKSALLELSWW